MRPGASFGEIGMGLLRAIRPWDDWIAGWGYDMADGDPDTDPERVTAKIRELIGDPDQEIEIVSCAPWYVNQANVTQWSSGRVFCGGDAVHRHPPSSGLGSNTSIQDGHNLAWKLAYAVRGWAGPEPARHLRRRTPARRRADRRPRQPVPRRLRPAQRGLRAPTGADDPIAAGLAKLRDPSPAGVEVRAALTAALELKNYEFNAQGVELNQRYTSTAVVPDPDAAPEQWDRDPQLYLQATTRPGAKVPHTWLVDRRGRRISTLDVTGQRPLHPAHRVRRPGLGRRGPQARPALPRRRRRRRPRHRGPLPRAGTGYARSTTPAPSSSAPTASSPGATSTRSGTTTTPRPPWRTPWPRSSHGSGR